MKKLNGLFSSDINMSDANQFNTIRFKPNCWEILGCERTPGGKKEKELGSCPASTCVYASGINGGIHAGRACWAISNTLCDGNVQECIETKRNTCLRCKVYKQVKAEEGENFVETKHITQQISGYVKY